MDKFWTSSKFFIFTSQLINKSGMSGKEGIEKSACQDQLANMNFGKKPKKNFNF